jgi:transcriptional regulator with GAF, ATPase, and Fis domain
MAASQLLDALEVSSDRVRTVVEFLEARTVARPVVLLPPEGMPLKEIERLAIVEALQRTNWVQVDAAKLLSVHPRVLHYKLKTHGLASKRGIA